MLPTDSGFHEILQSAVPPGWLNHKHKTWGESAIVIRTDGMPELVNFQELDEYLLGGECDEVISDDLETEVLNV